MDNHSKRHLTAHKRRQPYAEHATRVVLVVLVLSHLQPRFGMANSPPLPEGEEVASASNPHREPPDETSKHYISFHQSYSGTKGESFNHQAWEHGTRSIQLVGKKLILDEEHEYNLVELFNGDLDVRELTIKAEEVIIREAIRLPSTSVTIYAEQLSFEDKEGHRAHIDTTPPTPRPAAHATFVDPNHPATSTIRAAEDGLDGLTAGDVQIYARRFNSQDRRLGRFILNGGAGGKGGRGMRGRKGTNAPKLFRLTEEGLLRCASRGLAKGKRQVCENWDYSCDYGEVVPIPSEITLTQLKNQAVLETWPAHGEDAYPGGKPGEGGDTGKFTTNLQELIPYVQQSPGRAGEAGGFYLGGAPGEPRSAIRVSDYNCDYFYYRGSSMTHLVIRKVEHRTVRAGQNAQSPRARRPWGEVAQNLLVSNQPMKWYDPQISDMAIVYAEDAFLNGFKDLARDVLEKHLGLIEATATDPLNPLMIPEEISATFVQQELRILSLLNRLNAHEDYFGNPEGWVPALSLEANKLLFEQETEWAIRTMGVIAWIQHENNKQQDKATALAVARRLLKEEIAALELKYEQARLRLPALQEAAGAMAVELGELQNEFAWVESNLVARAQRNVEDRHKLPFWKKGLKVLAVLSKVVPIPYADGVEKTLDVLIGLDPDKPLNALTNIADVASAFAETDTKKEADEAKKKVEAAKKQAEEAEKKAKEAQKRSQTAQRQIKEAERKEEEYKNAGLSPDQTKEEAEAEAKAAKAEAERAQKKAKEAQEKLEKEKNSLKRGIKETAKYAKPIIKQIAKHKDLIKGSEAPKDEVQKELQKLKKEDPEFRRLAERVQSLLKDKESLIKEIGSVLEALESSLVTIGANYLAVADLSPKLDKSSKVILTEKATLTLKDMYARSIKRLQKYHYWLAQAFEYRILQAHPGDLNFTEILFEPISDLIVARQIEEGELDTDAYNHLFVLYRDELSKITKTIIERFNNNSRLTQTPIYFPLTPAELDALNRGERVAINLWEEEVFGDYEENIRIVDIGFSNLVAVASGNCGRTCHMDLDVEHEGTSRVWKNRQVSNFEHYNKGSTPIMWSTRFHKNGSITREKLSNTDESLLRSLLINDDEEIMMFLPAVCVGHSLD